MRVGSGTNAVGPDAQVDGRELRASATSDRRRWRTGASRRRQAGAPCTSVSQEREQRYPPPTHLVQTEQTELLDDVQGAMRIRAGLPRRLALHLRRVNLGSRGRRAGMPATGLQESAIIMHTREAHSSRFQEGCSDVSMVPLQSKGLTDLVKTTCLGVSRRAG